MPITSSAKKAMRQAETRARARKPFKTKLKTEVKKVLTLTKSDVAQAKKALPEAFSIIDTAAKKNLIHKNNANRKKAMLARAIARAEVSTKK